MPDRENNISSKTTKIGKKPLTIGGRLAGVRRTPSSVNQSLFSQRQSVTESKTIDGSERLRRLKMFESINSVKERLRIDAERADSSVQKRLLQEKQRDAIQQRKKEDSRSIADVKKNYGAEKTKMTLAKPQEKRSLATHKVKSKNDFSHKAASPKKSFVRGIEERRQKKAKFTVSNALMEADESFDAPSGQSLASIHRRREKERLKAKQALLSGEKVVREVTVPETIRVSDLANRMAERVADVIKELMKLGIVVNASQFVDADTAELVIAELGHTIKRVSESAAEGLFWKEGEADKEEDLQTRAPIVTVMGHVNHGKTSLLDALCSTNTVVGESGGITQHIGAYTVTTKSGEQIVFLDTPGHEAFTQMRQRGVLITDIVVLVVAADDGIKPQTIEAIDHAMAASTPIIVAINKVDKPDIDVKRVQSQLLDHKVQTENLGGDVLCVQISAKFSRNLHALEDAILLQAGMLNLRANPKAIPQGVVIEAKLERGRGPVATVILQRGTLKIGQIIVAGKHWGRARALVDDKGKNIKSAYPFLPVEVLGWNGTPKAGDRFLVVKSEMQAREITQYRTRQSSMKRNVFTAKEDGSVENIFKNIKNDANADLSLIIKADTQGSLEAIKNSLAKIDEDEQDVKIRFIREATGHITETDVTLAQSCKAMILGFNVRVNAQARVLAAIKDESIVRYYSVIYELIDDVKQMLSGMLAPKVSEKPLGSAEVRQIFKLGKIGRVAGCYVTEGHVRHGASIRILRDDVVVYEGSLKHLKREKSDVKEVRQACECGMMFGNYDAMERGDIVKCFETVSEARKI